MVTLLRSQAVVQVALDPARGKGVEVAVEAVAAVGVVALVVVATERNQLVWLARRKGRQALEQAILVQIQDPFLVQTGLEARQEVVQEVASDSCPHDGNPLSETILPFFVLILEKLFCVRSGCGRSQY
jgi:hypothetical protein